MDLIERYNPSKDVLLYEHGIISLRLSEQLQDLVILLHLQPVKLIPVKDMMYHGLELLRQLLHPCNHYIHKSALLVVTIYFSRQSSHSMSVCKGQQDQRRVMDEEYVRLREEIEGSRLALRVAPYHKMHISAWLRKMDEGMESDAMRRARNNYAKLLNLMCECEVIVAPFDRPPEDCLAKLSKQRINQIIDEVEEAVKQGQEVQGVNESREAFNQVGVPSSSVLASEAEEVVEDEEEHSQVIGRFVNESVKRTQDYSGTYFSVMEESRESETSEEKKTFFSDMKSGSVDLFPIAMDCKMRQERKKVRHIKVEINTFHTKMPASPAFERIGESRRKQQLSPSFSDISQQLCESQRSFHKNIDLSKEAISQQSALSQTNCQQIEEILSEDPDFSSQLSERCMEKDHPRNSQIAWAFKKQTPASEANFHKQKLTLTESIPSKGLFRTSTFNSKNSSLVKEAQSLKCDPDESFTSKLSLASELRDYETSPLRDLTNFSFLAI